MPNGSIKLMLPAIFATLGFFFVAAGAQADSTLQLTYFEGRVTLTARQAPLFGVLRALADATGIAVSATEDFVPGSVNLELIDEPLEEALKRILRETNYAAVYAREGETYRLAALKIYPSGRLSGELVPVAQPAGEALQPALQPFDQIVLVRSGEEIATFRKGAGRAPGDYGLLLPENFFNLKTAEYSGTLGGELQMQETRAFEEIELLRNRIDETQNMDTKQALSLVLAQKLDDFDTLQRSNHNQMEALYRLDLFNQQKAKQSQP